MKRVLVIIAAVLSFGLVQAQTLTYSGYVLGPVSGAKNAPVKLYRRDIGGLDVKVFSTHFGNGNTSQYANYPMTTSEFNKCFNTAYSATTLKWSGKMPATTALNWSNASTLISAGATVPNSNEYFSVEVSGTFVPAVTGTYSFGVNSDDGGDIIINGTVVTTYYGGHGMSGPMYGNIYLVAGNSYTFVARMQEFGGGEGLAVVWKRPGQSVGTLQTSEFSTSPGAWSLLKTLYTNTNGYFAVSETNTANYQYYLEFTSPNPVTTLSMTDGATVSSLIFAANKTGLNYQVFDLNNDGAITVTDQYLVFARRAGMISGWFGIPNSRLYTTTQFSAISSATSNVRAAYPGASSIQSSVLVSGGTMTVYLISPGYSGQVTY